MTTQQNTQHTAYSIAQSIAPLLPGYTASQIEKEGQEVWDIYAYLIPTDKNKPTITINYHTKDKKVTFSHSVLSWYDKVTNTRYQRNTYNEDRPSINCSVTRSPQILANEITRRLMPDAQIAHDKDLEYKASIEHQKNAKATMIASLSEVAEVRVNSYNNGAYIAHFPAQAEISDTGSLSISRLYISDPAKAKAVAKALLDILGKNG